AVAEMAIDARVIAELAVLGRIVTIELATALASFTRSAAESVLDDAPAEPAARRMAAQAIVADAGLADALGIVVRDIERGPEQWIAQCIRHHRTTPGRMRHELGCARVRLRM